MSRALLLVGAPGAGKSSILEALGSALERDGIAYGSIESEQLSTGWPLLEASVWIPALAAVLSAQRAAARDRFLVAATPETAEELAALQAAIPVETLRTVCLSAPPDLVAARIDAREPDSWPGKPRLLAHARALAVEIPAFPGLDATISTAGREAADVAAHLVREIQGVQPGTPGQ